MSCKTQLWGTSSPIYIRTAVQCQPIEPHTPLLSPYLCEALMAKVNIMILVVPKWVSNCVALIQVRKGCQPRDARSKPPQPCTL